MSYTCHSQQLSRPPRSYMVLTILKALSTGSTLIHDPNIRVSLKFTRIGLVLRLIIFIPSTDSTRMLHNITSWLRLLEWEACSNRQEHRLGQWRIQIINSSSSRWLAISSDWLQPTTFKWQKIFPLQWSISKNEWKPVKHEFWFSDWSNIFEVDENSGLVRW